MAESVNPLITRRSLRPIARMARFGGLPTASPSASPPPAAASRLLERDSVRPIASHDSIADAPCHCNIGHNYICHNYTGHNCKGHGYIGQSPHDCIFGRRHFSYCVRSQCNGVMAFPAAESSLPSMPSSVRPKTKILCCPTSWKMLADQPCHRPPAAHRSRL